MDYFKNFPIITYDFTTNEDTKKIHSLADVTTRVQSFYEDESIDLIFDSYYIRDGDTPEKISYKIYGTTDYYWTIMYVNNLFDMTADWPLSSDELEDYAKKLYPNKSASIKPSDSFTVEIKPYAANTTTIDISIINEASIIVNRPDMVVPGTFVSENLSPNSYVKTVTKDEGQNKITLTLSRPTISSMNNITNQTFRKGIEDYLNVSHYITANGIVKDIESFGANEKAYIISKLQAMYHENDKKRYIKVVKQDSISAFVNLYFNKIV
jgi:hypothetical protein